MPLSSELGTYTPVEASFWPCLELFFKDRSLKSFKLFPVGSEAWEGEREREGQKESERERERGRGREGMRAREREIESEEERGRERERER